VPSPCQATLDLSHTNSTSQVTAGINKCAFKFIMQKTWNHCAKWENIWLTVLPICRGSPNPQRFQDATLSYLRSSSLCGLPVRKQIKLHYSSCLLNQGRSLLDSDSNFMQTSKRHLDLCKPMSLMKKFPLIRLTVCLNLLCRRSKTEDISRLFLSFRKKKWRNQSHINYHISEWT